MASGGWGSSLRSQWTRLCTPRQTAARMMVQADETGIGPVAPCPSLGTGSSWEIAAPLGGPQASVAKAQAARFASPALLSSLAPTSSSLALRYPSLAIQSSAAVSLAARCRSSVAPPKSRRILT